MLTASPTLHTLFNVERVTIVWNCSDGWLMHLAGLKLKNPTLKLGKGGCATIFVGGCSCCYICDAEGNS